MSTGGAWVVWTIVVPLVGALASWLVGRRSAAIALVAALATVAVAVMCAIQVLAHGTAHVRVGGWGAPLGIELRADGMAAVLVGAFAPVVALTTASAIGFFPAGRRRTGALTLSFVAWAGLNALLVSADLFNLYVALELITLATVGLVSLGGTREATSAALRYLYVALLGSLGYLVGVAFVYGGCATLDMELAGRRLDPGVVATAAFAMIAAGLSLKSALFPLHAWLPAAYASAPPPASALLSGALGKAAFFVVYRAGTDVFPFVLGAGPAQLLGAQGAAAVLWASLIALRQQRLKMLIAYSSLAHVGYLFLAFPMTTPLARAGAVYIAISHAAASAAMFTAAGTIERAVGTDSIEGLKGVAQRHPIAFFSLAIGGVSLMGLPPSGGFVAKWLLVSAAFECGQWWWAVVVLAGGLIAAAYVFRLLRGAFLPVAPPRVGVVPPRGTELVSLVLASIVLVLGVAPRWPIALVMQSDDGAVP